jgi:hypothetical protein
MKRIHIILFSIALSCSLFAQTPLGEIYGNDEENLLGHAIATSDDGSIVAVISRNYSSTNFRSGAVKVMRIKIGSWDQIGSDILGVAEEDKLSTVALSSDGLTLAVGSYYNDGNGKESGHVRIFNYINGSWNQLGSDIQGEAVGDQSGYAISLSSNGRTVAIGAVKNQGNGINSGHARVYHFDSTKWVQMGSDIDGESEGDYSGQSVVLSDDGKIVAIGASYNSSVFSSAGHVRVFEYTSGNWTQRGKDLDGKWSNGRFGLRVSMSGNGDYLAISAHVVSIGNEQSVGKVQVFHYDSSDWTQTGSDINGAEAGDLFGSSVSLSSSGKVLAVGAFGSNNHNGEVSVFEFDSTGQWIKTINDIKGKDTERSGLSVALSGDGKIVVVGSPYNDVNGKNAGRIAAYKNTWSTLSLQKIKSNQLLSLFPNPSIDRLNIELSPTLIGSDYYLYDLHGKAVISGRFGNIRTSIDVSELSGLYHLKCEGLSNESLKVIIQ